MQYFIGIVPPDEYKSKIISFQQQWKNNTISQVVEPHITLKAQGGLTEDLHWVEKIESVCKETQPFSIMINKPKFFGKEILYLSCTSLKLTNFHNKIVNAINPSENLIQKYFERDKFVAHMTLGKVYYGLSEEELLHMAKLAEGELTPYPNFQVNFIRIYQDNQANLYTKYKDIPLTGGL